MVQGASMFPEPHIPNAVVPDNVGMVANGSKGVPTSRTTHINAIVPDNRRLCVVASLLGPLPVSFSHGKGFLPHSLSKGQRSMRMG
jgi:hypothetical protein